MDRRKRNSITIESDTNKETRIKKISINLIKNEELYLLDEAYGKLNELSTLANSDISLKNNNTTNIDILSKKNSNTPSSSPDQTNDK